MFLEKYHCPFCQLSIETFGDNFIQTLRYQKAKIEAHLDWHERKIMENYFEKIVKIVKE